MDYTTHRSAARSADRLRAASLDGAAFGIWSSVVDLQIAELVASLPYDYVCVDLQHGAATYSELPGMLQAMRAAGRAPVVRVPWNEPASIMRAIDTGAAGVVVPMVSSAREAAAAARACRFPPDGTRSWGPMWGDIRPDGALPPEQQNSDVLCLVMIETSAGVDALEEIVRTPGVDGIYIGPNDLALACGYGRLTYREDTALESLIQRIVDACRVAGSIAGLHCSDPAMARDWSTRGATMLTVSQDTGLLADAGLKALAQARGRSVLDP